MFKNLNDFTIYITEKCNFDCSYCYFKKDFASSLDENKINKAIDIFFKQIDPKKKVFITILGGEPLIEKKLLLKTLKLINEKSKKMDLIPKIYLFTNGSLLKNEDVKILIDEGIDICISIDGIKESNDCYRKFRLNNSSTFCKVYKNLSGIDKKYFKKIHANMVIGPENCSNIKKNIKFLSKLGFGSIDLSLMSYSKWGKSNLKELVNGLDWLYNYYISLFNQKNKPFKMYQLDDLFYGGWCKMDRCNKIKIAPDGNFYFCDAFLSAKQDKKRLYRVGNLKNGFSYKLIEKLKSDASKGIAKIFPKTFLLHSQNKLVYCPYGVYYYTKVHNKDLRLYLKRFYTASKIYSSFLMCLFNSLKNNKKFCEFYKNGKL
jgi:sulfatase maturation enzyme AslB (radical SAM superfamily)